MTEWHPSEDQMLTALWAQGLSTMQIAARMQGRTKNSVIGRAHRLELPARLSPIKNPKPLKRPAPPVWQAKACQWIDGEPDGVNTIYCGQPTKDGLSWCAAHKARVFSDRRPSSPVSYNLKWR